MRMLDLGMLGREEDMLIVAAGVPVVVREQVEVENRVHLEEQQEKERGTIWQGFHDGRRARY